ncbi:hypothetical protein [Bartonella sp. HY761]|uniref:hypothetical protein n=1 Tax=Bartonella sp. HY761 TaxID=2979330 RepID=UPI00220BC588|nr:hypothetical protein [Bartonella sp. HY761]UXN07319.1 hypothetical protein N6A79_04780 [Bartonella sp. HY761]
MRIIGAIIIIIAGVLGLAAVFMQAYASALGGIGGASLPNHEVNGYTFYGTWCSCLCIFLAGITLGVKSKSLVILIIISSLCGIALGGILVAATMVISLIGCGIILSSYQKIPDTTL